MAAVKETWSSSGRDGKAPWKQRKDGRKRWKERMEGKLQGYKGRLDQGVKLSRPHSEEANGPLYSV